MRSAQRRIAHRRVGQQVDQSPAVQAAQRTKSQQPRQRHAQCPGQKRQNQKADGLSYGICRRIAAFPVEILRKAVPDALDPAVLAVLLQRIARRVVGLLGVGIGGRADTDRGMGVDPCAGKRRDQLVHVLGVAALGVKVKVPHGNRIGAQIMVCLIGGLHRRICKDEQRTAQKDARRAPFGKVLDPAQKQRRCARQDAEPHTKAGDGQRRKAPGVQPVEYAPVVAGHDAQRGAQHQHESPPGGGVLHGG